MRECAHDYDDGDDNGDEDDNGGVAERDGNRKMFLKVLRTHILYNCY